MRKVKKDFNKPPEALLDAFKNNTNSLLTKKGNHDPKQYNVCKEALLELYQNKCAYCEQFVAQSGSESVTIEHYRPKKGGYWWLAYEWSNLYPLCKTCNNIKGDNFKIANRKAKEPVIKNENNEDVFDDLAKFRADSHELLAEKPYFIHPEIDEPQDFFELEKSGKIIVKKGISAENKTRAEETLKIFQPPTEEIRTLRRKKIIDDILKDIENVATRIGNKLLNPNPLLAEDLFFAFDIIFEKMGQQAYDESREFTFVGQQALEKIDDFFIRPMAEINPLYGEWLKAAFINFSK